MWSLSIFYMDYMSFIYLSHISRGTFKKNRWTNIYVLPFFNGVHCNAISILIVVLLAICKYMNANFPPCRNVMNWFPFYLRLDSSNSLVYCRVRFTECFQFPHFLNNSRILSLIRVSYISLVAFAWPEMVLFFYHDCAYTRLRRCFNWMELLIGLTNVLYSSLYQVLSIPYLFTNGIFQS